MLEILICTIDEGISRAIKVPLSQKVEQVCYLISWQQSKDIDFNIPKNIQDRTDIRIVTLKGKGLSRNRNHAFAHAKGDILLLSDDDTHYEPIWFENILSSFARYHEADILLFQATNEHHLPIKEYPAHKFYYNDRPRKTYFSSCEIAMRRETNFLHFDERFGLAADFLNCGEEEIFLHNANKNGKTIIYIPTPIVRTRQETTGTHFATNSKVRRSKGAVLCVIHGPFSAILRCIKFTLTHKGFNKLRALKDMLDGIFYIMRHE